MFLILVSVCIKKEIFYLRNLFSTKCFPVFTSLSLPHPFFYPSLCLPPAPLSLCISITIEAFSLTRHMVTFWRWVVCVTYTYIVLVGLYDHYSLLMLTTVTVLTHCKHCNIIIVFNVIIIMSLLRAHCVLCCC